ncbi:hypothetical protein C8Q78DRAFT_1074516 [Trametes maxima]|nr:hypothetical protein C8Q78DRAFT_1074516 [Trametes maxima]
MDSSLEWDALFCSPLVEEEPPLAPQSPQLGKLISGTIDVPRSLFPRDLPSQTVTPPVSISPAIKVLPYNISSTRLQRSDTTSTPDAEDHTAHAATDSWASNTVLSVSTTFHPTANLLPIPPDLILVSSDEVFFYAHTTRVLSVSNNHFNNIVSPDAVKSNTGDAPGPASCGPLACVPESATVLNVLLHCAYGLPCEHYRPTLDTLIAAVDAMPSYGLSPTTHVLRPPSPLSSLILAQAPVHPLAAYALAARHDLLALAQPVSSHLLSFPSDACSAELAAQIGAVYLKRLCLLHLQRLDALRRLLMPAPHPHPPTDDCDFVDQKRLTRAWTLTAAYLAWDARPDVSPSTIQSAFAPLSKELACDQCRQSLADRVKSVVVQWSVVKRTI